MNIMHFFKPHSLIAALLIVSFLGAPLFFLKPRTTIAQAGGGLTGCFSGFGGGSSSGAGGGSSSGAGGGSGSGSGSTGGGQNAVPVKNKIIEDKTTSLEKKESCLDGIVTLAVRALAQTMTQDIIRWINSGFKGQPGFVDNPKRFLGSVANTISGAFINEVGLAGLCEPFRPQIQIALFAVPSYKEKAQCTFSGIVKNMNAFANDFNEGGWTAWISTVQPQNNAFGSYFLATDERYSRMLAAQQNARDDANQSRGFLSQYQCDFKDDADFGVDENNVDIPGDNWVGTAEARSYAGPYYDGGMEACIAASKVNLGSVLASQTDFALTIDGRQILAADEIGEMISAIIGTFFNKLITDGLANLTREKNKDLFDIPDPFEQYKAPLLASLNTAIASTTAYLTAYRDILTTLADLVEIADDRIACWEAVDAYIPDPPPAEPTPPLYTAKITEIQTRKKALQAILDKNAPVDAQNINAATTLLQRLNDILAMITPPNNDISGALIAFQSITNIPSQEDIDAAEGQLLIYAEELFGPEGANEDLLTCQALPGGQPTATSTPLTL